jgi:2-desacetyl-2-hydroxyethyl bacteriochlorophyllide A dehydrogenase
MKALMLKGIGQLELVETNVPPIADDQIMVRTRAATICTSDLVDVDHNLSSLTFPVVLGHEGMGIVAATGKDVTGFQIGQSIATHPVHPCYHCSACKAGNSHLCLNMGHFGLNMPGTFAEYYVVRADRARVVADDLAPAQVCLAEPLSVCLEALDQANVRPGGTLLIVGDGPFGIIMARLSETLGLGNVVIAGWSDFRLGFAGRVTTVNTSDCPAPVETLLDLNNGVGYEAAILAVASPQALADALRCLRPKARLVMFSAFTDDVPVNLLSVHLKELEIIGSCNDQDRFDEAVQRLADNRWSELITHHFPLDDFANAFAVARAGKDCALKVSLGFEHGN